MGLPVSSISSARLRPTLRLTATIGVEQNDRPPLGTPALPLQLVGELAHQRRGEGVALVRPVERDEDRRKGILDAQVCQLGCHQKPPTAPPISTGGRTG